MVSVNANSGTDRTLETPVLIVGGGPTGLCASILLSRFGIRSLLVERHPSYSVFPRARSVHRRAMEIFRTWGLEDLIHARELDLEPVIVTVEKLSGPVLRRMDYIPRLDLSLSPCRTSPIHQDQLEPVLLELALSYGSADVRFATELESFAVLEQGVEAELRDRRSGARSRVRARFLIGADGASSGVRRRMGIAMEGPDHLADNLLIQFRADVSRLTGARPPWMYQLPGSDGGQASMLYSCGAGHVWLLNVGPEAGDPVAAVRAAIGGDLDVDILGTAAWTAAAQVADRYRSGPVFLAGDAAHRLTPAGGMGMNTGIHDVHNLAWKLAGVLHGWAGEAVLDTYEVERRPVGRRNVSLVNWNALMSESKAWPPGTPTAEAIDLGAVYESAAVVPDRAAESEGTAAQPANAPLGGRAPHAWIQTPQGRVSTIDLFDQQFVLLTGPAGSEWCGAASAAALALGVPFRALTLAEPDWALAYGVGREGAVLVRPDGHLAWRTQARPADPRQTLTEIVRAVAQRTAERTFEPRSGGLR